MRTNRMVLLFVLINLLALVLAVPFLFADPVAALREALTTKRLAQNRLTMREKALADYETIAEQLYAAETAWLADDFFIPPYGASMDALDEVGYLCAAWHLTELSFVTGQIVAHTPYDDPSIRVIETQVSASYEGALTDVLGFLHELSEGAVYYHIRGFTFDMVEQNGETGAFTRLYVDFAVYGEW